ncbi:MAG: hypothetical protein FWG98_06625 [Candidatus Cloacimonetes bacterium]|nr:hypothetical protein [Candidatus Cloacimonadota bacterium]
MCKLLAVCDCSGGACLRPIYRYIICLDGGKLHQYRQHHEKLTHLAEKLPPHLWGNKDTETVNQFNLEMQTFTDFFGNQIYL